MLSKLTLILIPLLLHAAETVDVVYLLDGSIIKGSIVEQVPNKSLKIKSGDNIFVYQMSNVERILKEPLDNQPIIDATDTINDDTPLKLGTTQIGGTVSYSKYSYDGEDLGSNTTISPSVGYFVSNSTCLNLGFHFDSRIYKSDGSKQTSSLTGFVAGLRFYQNLTSNLGYLGASFTSLTQRVKYSDDYYGTESDSQVNNYLFFETGILQKLNKYVYLDFGVGYLKGLGDNKSGTLSFGVGVATFMK
jgi:hypothetical protein